MYPPLLESPMNFKNFWSFSGRINRRGYWLEYGSLTLASLLLVPAGLFGGVAGSVLQVLGSLAITVGIFAISARRLHDTGRSGWYQMWWLGGLFVLALLVIALSTMARTDPAFLVGAGAGMLGGLSVLAHSLYVLGVQKGNDETNSYGTPSSGAVFSD